MVIASQDKLFLDRRQAGKALAPTIASWGLADPIILALPRGGVPLAEVLGQVAGYSWELLLVTKIAWHKNRQVAIGAISEYGLPQLDHLTIEQRGYSSTAVADSIAWAQERLEYQRMLYRANQDPVEIRGRPVVVVDDFLDQGWTVRAAIAALDQAGVTEIYGAFPLARKSTLQELQVDCQSLFATHQLESFSAPGDYYQYFPDISEKEVIQAVDTRRFNSRGQRGGDH